MTAYSLSETYGMFAKREIDAMKRIVQGLPNNPVAVVLGSGPGTMTLTLLEAREDILVYSIDLFYSHSEKLHATTGGSIARLHQVRSQSEPAGRSWNQPIDLLAIDAFHTYDAVKEDSAAWLPHLKDMGIVWYHDYGTSNKMYLEVKRAVDEDMEGQEQVVRVCSSIAFRRNS